jgi:hypothetical protein
MQLVGRRADKTGAVASLGKEAPEPKEAI